MVSGLGHGCHQWQPTPLDHGAMLQHGEVSNLSYRSSAWRSLFQASWEHVFQRAITVLPPFLVSVQAERTLSIWSQSQRPQI